MTVWAVIQQPFRKAGPGAYAGAAQKRAGPFQVNESDDGTRLRGSIGRRDYRTVFVANPKSEHRQCVNRPFVFINIAGSTFMLNIFFLLPSRSQINVINLFNFNDLIFVVLMMNIVNYFYYHQYS
jgi:hypothetical protein